MKALLDFLVTTGVLLDDSAEALVDLSFSPDSNEYSVEVFDGECWLNITNIWADGTDGKPVTEYYAWITDFDKDVAVSPKNLRLRCIVTGDVIYFGD